MGLVPSRVPAPLFLGIQGALGRLAVLERWDAPGRRAAHPGQGCRSFPVETTRLTRGEGRWRAVGRAPRLPLLLPGGAQAWFAGPGPAGVEKQACAVAVSHHDASFLRVWSRAPGVLSAAARWLRASSLRKIPAFSHQCPLVRASCTINEAFRASRREHRAALSFPLPRKGFVLAFIFLTTKGTGSWPAFVWGCGTQCM